MGLQETLHDQWCMEMANPKLINDTEQKASKKQTNKRNQIDKYLKQKQQQQPLINITLCGCQFLASLMESTESPWKVYQIKIISVFNSEGCTVPQDSYECGLTEDSLFT